MKLFSRTYGTGSPMLILHGLFGMSDNWNTLGKKWAEELKRNVHIIDMRNHGRSDWASPHDYHAMSEDLEEYMDANEIKSATVLGHSMGGKAAMFLATLAPEKVDQLIVADIGPKAYPIHHQEIIDALLYVHGKKPNSRSKAQELLGEKISHQGIQFFLLKSLHRKDDGIYGWRFNLEQINKDIENVGIALPPPAQYEGPTCFIRGDKSNYILDEDLDKIHAHFPQAILETIKDAGHWLHAEQPDAFSEVVEKFLRN